MEAVVVKVSTQPKIRELPKFSEISDEFRKLSRNPTGDSKYKPILDLLLDMKTVKLEEKDDTIIQLLRAALRTHTANKFRLRSIRQTDYFVIWAEAK